MVWSRPGLDDAPPLTVPEECPIGVALGQMRTTAIRHLVVVDGDRVTGIVSNRDVRRLLDDPTRPPRLGAPVRRIMSEGPVTVAPETPVATAARLLLENRIGALPVRDGDDVRCVGGAGWRGWRS